MRSQVSTIYNVFKKAGFSGVVKRYKERRLIYSPRLLSGRWKNENINSPVFMLGVQSAGMTIVGRMLKRSPEIVSVTGDHKYWAGSEEMAFLYAHILPSQLTGRFYFLEQYLKCNGVDLKPESECGEMPKDLSRLYSRYGTTPWWNYACDDLLPYFRADGGDFTQEASDQLMQLIQKALYIARSKGEKRFLDKSQIFSLKVPLLEKIFSDSLPKYIIVLRNPYAVCQKAVSRDALSNLKLSSNELLEVAAEHYANTYRLAIDDTSGISERVHVVRIEDFLSNPPEQLRRVCDFSNIEYNDDLLPHEHHALPFGSPDKTKWYPLYSDVNSKYLSKLTRNDQSVIHKVCGGLIEKFGYEIV